MLDKECGNNPHISWKAKGLHAYIMGLPPTWEINLVDLSKRSPDGRTAVSSALAELERHGYLKRVVRRDERGRLLGSICEVSERAEQ